jgi:hypothetical protein
VVFGSFATNFDPSYVNVAGLYGSSSSFASPNRTLDAPTKLRTNSAPNFAEVNFRSDYRDPSPKASSLATRDSSVSNLNSAAQSRLVFQPSRRKELGCTLCPSHSHSRRACRNWVKCRRCLNPGHIGKFCSSKRQVLVWLPKAQTTSGNIKIVWRPKIPLLAQDSQQSTTATDDQQDGNTSFNSDFPHLDPRAAPSPVPDSLYSTTRE